MGGVGDSALLLDRGGAAGSSRRQRPCGNSVAVKRASLSSSLEGPSHEVKLPMAQRFVYRRMRGFSLLRAAEGRSEQERCGRDA